MVIFLLICEFKMCQDNFTDSYLPEDLIYFLNLSLLSHHDFDHFLHK